MKIDMHVHVTPLEIINNYQHYAQKEAYFGLLANTPHNKFATAEQVVQEMKITGYDKSVIFGFSFADMGLCQYVNDYVIEAVKKYPDELIGFISVVPNHKQVCYEIERCYNKGLRGIGELFPAGQPFEITKKEDILLFAQCCENYNMPVIVHMNEPVGHYYEGKTSTSLKEIETFILNHPTLKVILAHFGGGIWQYELMKEVKSAFENVYYDNAASIFLYEPRIYQTIKAAGLMDKFFFGSDYPLLSPSRYEKSLLNSGLNQEDLDKLQGENAKRLLKNCHIL